MPTSAINTIGPLILIAAIAVVGVYAGVRWLRATTPQQRNWWGIRAGASFALALFVALNQYILHLRWPG
ncbi:MAG TPA: hypothetical protein VIC27_04555 [Ktedonobacterales bacterium]|jgi:uncharacterized transporter YbjL